MRFTWHGVDQCTSRWRKSLAASCWDLVPRTAEWWAAEFSTREGEIPACYFTACFLGLGNLLAEPLAWLWRWLGTGQELNRRRKFARKLTWDAFPLAQIPGNNIHPDLLDPPAATACCSVSGRSRKQNAGFADSSGEAFLLFPFPCSIWTRFVEISLYLFKCRVAEGLGWGVCLPVSEGPTEVFSFGDTATAHGSFFIF